MTDWLRSEAVQSLIADLLKSSQALLELRLTRARMETAGILEAIAKTSEDPTERRRAATALFHRPFARPKDRTYRLYKLDPAPTIPPFTTPPPSAPQTEQLSEQPSSPIGGGAGVLAGGGGSSLRAFSTDAPNSSALSSASQPTSAASPSPCHLATPSPCPRPSPLTDHSSPPHSSSPRTLISALFHAFADRDARTLAHIFRDHSSKSATLDGRPLALVLPLHPLAQMHLSRETASKEIHLTDTTASYTFTFLRDPLSPSRAAFRFDLKHDAPKGWLIQSISTLDTT